MTHTYAVLEVSRATYDEIRVKLDRAGYQHAFDDDGTRTVIDMHGIALAVDRVSEPAVVPCNVCIGHTKGALCIPCVLPKGHDSHSRLAWTIRLGGGPFIEPRDSERRIRSGGGLMASKKRDYEAVWNAAYAAAYVARHKAGLPGEDVLRVGEESAKIADAAVQALGLVEGAARIADLQEHGQPDGVHCRSCVEYHDVIPANDPPCRCACHAAVA